MTTLSEVENKIIKQNEKKINQNHRVLKAGF